MVLPMREGVPSDGNYLNMSLAQTNDMFNDLLDVEEKIGQLIKINYFCPSRSG